MMFGKDKYQCKAVDCKRRAIHCASVLTPSGEWITNDDGPTRVLEPASNTELCAEHGLAAEQVAYLFECHIDLMPLEEAINMGIYDH
jgi:hypothetical protein